MQILKELHLGPLVEVNLEQMRARAHDNIHKMKVKEDDKPLWWVLYMVAVCAHVTIVCTYV